MMRVDCSLRSRVSAWGVWAQVYELTAYKNEVALLYLTGYFLNTKLTRYA